MSDLVPQEADALAEHEETIRVGLSTFLDVGRALLAIRDGRLYRTDHETFESYCRDRWGMEYERARQMMQAARVADEIATTPTTVGVTSERQARELAPLLDQPERLRETWQQAVEETGGKPTAAAIRSIVRPPSPEHWRPVGAGTAEARAAYLAAGGETETSTPDLTGVAMTREQFVAQRDTGEVLSVEDWQAQERMARHDEVASGLDRAIDTVPGARDEMDRKALRARWASRIAAAAEINTMDAEQVRSVLTNDEAAAARLVVRGLTSWIARFSETGQSGLRIVGGDR